VPLEERSETLTDFRRAARDFQQLADPRAFEPMPSPAWLAAVQSHVESVRPLLTVISTPRLNQIAAHGALPALLAETRLGLRWRFESLLAASYWQLTRLLEAGTPPRRCDNPTCGRLFVPTRSDRRFHSNKCGSVVRQRERRQEAKRDGPRTYTKAR
jgi:hypothetical protein